MAVLLTVSESLSGGAVADSLSNGGTGVDLGSVTNNSFAPLVDKPTNDGAQNLYIRHDASVDEITAVKFFMQEYGVGTGFSYGGADSAANDFATLKALANGSGDSKNNGDGLSGGLWHDQDSDVSTASQFDFATNGIGSGNGTVAKYGDNNTDGLDLASAFPHLAASQVFDSAGEQQASSPVAGQIGKSGDTVLGDQSHQKLRVYLTDAFSSGGIVQWEWVIAYSFTS